MHILLIEQMSPNFCSSINRNEICYIYLKIVQYLDTEPIENVLWIVKSIRR